MRVEDYPKVLHVPPPLRERCAHHLRSRFGLQILGLEFGFRVSSLGVRLKVSCFRFRV